MQSRREWLDCIAPVSELLYFYDRELSMRDLKIITVDYNMQIVKSW